MIRSVVRRFRRFSKLEFKYWVSHCRCIKDVVHRIPGVTTKPICTKGKVSFLRLKIGHMRPSLAGRFGHEHAIFANHHYLLLVVAKEGTLPKY